MMDQNHFCIAHEKHSRDATCGNGEIGGHRRKKRARVSNVQTLHITRSE